MSRVLRRSLLIGAAALFSAPCVFASDAGSTGMNFLKLEVGARQSAMAGGGVALADDANAVRHNPSGMAFFEKPEAGFLLTSYQQDTNYGHGALALPTSVGAFGLQITDLSYGHVDGYDANNNVASLNKSGDTAAGLSYAHRIGNNLGLGATVRYLQERLDNLTAHGESVDVGALYHVASSHPLWSKVSIGASLENAGPSVRFIDQRAKLPQQIVIGAGLRRFKNFSSHTELHLPVDVSPYAAVGGEYEWQERFALRAGYRSGVVNGAGISLGGGARLGVAQFDVAWTPYSKLDDVIQFGVLFHFGTATATLAKPVPASLEAAPSATQKILPTETLTAPRAPETNQK